MTNRFLALPAALLALLLASCGGDRTVPDEQDPPPVVVEEAVPEEVVTVQPLQDDEETRDLLSRTTLYFAYDSSDLREEDRRVVEAHALYLADNPDVRLTLEGHADERGTREYNLALGQHRSVAVSRYFQALHIGADRLDTVSYGEERPVSQMQEESGWSLNRRVEIIYHY